MITDEEFFEKYGMTKSQMEDEHQATSERNYYKGCSQ